MIYTAAKKHIAGMFIKISASYFKCGLIYNPTDERNATQRCL